MSRRARDMMRLACAIAAFASGACGPSDTHSSVQPAKAAVLEAALSGTFLPRETARHVTIVWLASREALASCANLEYLVRSVGAAAGLTEQGRMILATDSTNASFERRISRHRLGVDLALVPGRYPPDSLTALLFREGLVVDEWAFGTQNTSFTAETAIIDQIARRTRQERRLDPPEVGRSR